MKLRSLIHSKNPNTLAFFNILGPIVLNGVNFFTIPIFTRMLGPANFGIVSLYSTWVQFFTVIVGLQTSGTISSSMVYYDEEEQKKYRASVLTLSLTSFLVVSAVVALFAGPIGAFTGLSSTLVLILLQSFGAFCINFATICYTYEKQAFRNFAISVLTTIATIALSLFLIFFVFPPETNYYGRIIGMAVPNILVGFLLFAYFWSKGRTGYNRGYWKFALPLAIPLVFHGLSQIVLSQTSKVMLQQYLDETAVGIYALIFTVTNILSVLYNALNNTWVPFFFDHMKAKEYDKIHKRTANYIFLFMILIMGFILVSPEVVKIFANEEFWGGIPLLPLLAFSVFMTFLYSFPVNFQFFHRRTVNIATGTVMAAIVNIVLNLWLIPAYGILGAGIATAIAYTALFAFHEFIAKRIIREDYPYGPSTYWWSIAGVLVACVLFYLLIDFWIVRWILGTLLGATLVVRTVRNRSIF